MLEVKGLSKRFRGLRAVNDVSFTLPHGSIVALVGPNGAGKTTTFNLIAGALHPDSGSIVLNGKDITSFRPDRACKAGVGRTFQIVRPFHRLTVFENVMVGALIRCRSTSAAKAKTKSILDALNMAKIADRPAEALTLPEKKRLEVAKALATQPRLLLLDEVMAGLRPAEVDEMVATFHRLREQMDLSILLTEHVMRAVMALAEKIIVMHHGEKICEGMPEQVVRDARVLESYLGHGTFLNGGDHAQG